MALWTLMSIALTFTANNACATPNLRPHWVTQPVVKLATNSSFLADTAKRAGRQSFLDGLIDPSAASAIRGEYETAARNYELRKLRGVPNRAIERTFVDKVSDLAKSVVNRIRDHQRNRGKEKALAYTRSMDPNDFKSAPVQVLGAVVAAASDTPMELQLYDTTSLVARANVGEAVGSVVLTSPLANGNFQFTPRGKERYNLSLNRGVPLSDMTSSVSYAGTSNVLTASLSKPLTETLVCVVDSSKTMTAGVQWNESIRLEYGYRF